MHLERDVCYIMTDFLSRFCIVGQSAAPPSTGLNPNTSACPASKVLRIIVFGKPVSTSLDFSLVIQVGWVFTLLMLVRSASVANLFTVLKLLSYYRQSYGQCIASVIYENSPFIGVTIVKARHFAFNSQINNMLVGREPWSRGYGTRLMFQRS